MAWKTALQCVLDASYAGLERAQLRWALIGSVASALQGCPVAPRDMDLLACTPEVVERFAGLMSPYAAASPADAERRQVDWLSSPEEPVAVHRDDYGYLWHFGRWFVADFQVEMAHIAPPDGKPVASWAGGIWEAGPEIWPHLRYVPFAGYPVPVVPLEIQLETSLERGLQERVGQIVDRLRQDGYDQELLDRRLAPRYRDEIQRLMQGS